MSGAKSRGELDITDSVFFLQSFDNFSRQCTKYPGLCGKNNENRKEELNFRTTVLVSGGQRKL